MSVTSGVDLDLSITELFPTDNNDQTVSHSRELPDHTATSPKYSFGNKSYPGNPDSDVLPYPSLINRKKSSTQAQKFFLLTSKEAQDVKLKEVQQKQNLQAAKKARQEARAKRVKENMKRKNEQAKKKSQKESKKPKTKTKQAQPSHGKSTDHNSKQNKKQSSKLKRHLKNHTQVDTTPCATCSKRYCDDDTAQSWIQCQVCDQWFHNACQGLEEEGPAAFIRISCEDQ